MKFRHIFGVLLCSVLLYFSYFGIGASTDKVIIATNADEEAIDAMSQALDKHGYKGAYVIQPHATSELGGKLIAEGRHMEADIVTQSTYYLKSAQKENDMFVEMPQRDNPKALKQYPNYMAPLLSNTSVLFVNEQALKERGLKQPQSIKDLTKPEYHHEVAIPNIMHASTGWLVIQSILDAYGRDEGTQVLKGLIKNVGPHLETSGSGPLKKVTSGEAAVGIGLRAQVIKAEKAGEPIRHIDPIEGNFSLVEAGAVVNKGGDKQKKAIAMLQTIQKEARPALLSAYPVPLYEGE